MIYPMLAFPISVPSYARATQVALHRAASETLGTL